MPVLKGTGVVCLVRASSIRRGQVALQGLLLVVERFEPIGDVGRTGEGAPTSRKIKYRDRKVAQSPGPMKRGVGLEAKSFDKRARPHKGAIQLEQVPLALLVTQAFSFHLFDFG